MNFILHIESSLIIQQKIMHPNCVFYKLQEKLSTILLHRHVIVLEEAIVKDFWPSFEKKMNSKTQQISLSLPLQF